MTTQTTSAILNSAIAEAQDLLIQYAWGEDLINDLTTAFGSLYDGDAAAALIKQWQTGDFGDFPEVEILSSASINGAHGAYSADTNKIYIADEYLQANAANQNAISNLVLEEFGHFVDSKINTVDAVGDEGAIFSGLVRGESFTDRELQQLQLENDQAVITLDGEEIMIEQRETDLPQNLDIRGNKTNLYVGDFNGDGRDDLLRQEKGPFSQNDRNNTANIIYADENGGFSLSTRVDLPENLDIGGHKTNLYVGDFNGDGRDDFLRQEKGSFSQDDRNTANIIFADENGGFSLSTRFDLPENFDIGGHEADLHVGDFNGDEFDDFIRRGKPGSGVSDRIFFSNGDGTFSQAPLLFPDPSSVRFRGSTKIVDVEDLNDDGLDDLLVQRTFTLNGNSVKRTEFLFSNGSGDFRTDVRLSRESSISQLDGDIQVHIGDFDGNGVSDFLGQKPGGSPAATIISDPGFEIRGLDVGDRFKDSIQGGAGNDNIIGFLGDDVLKGASGDDVLNGFNGNDTLEGGDGEDTLIGDRNDDVLDGGQGDDVLDGGNGNDVLDGGQGDDALRGGGNNDVLDGGAGFDLALYRGTMDEFDITINDDGSITVTDINPSNGDEGTDTLTNITQLGFGGNTRLSPDNDRNTVLGIAGVHESTDNTDTSTSIFGGNAAATNFVIDIEGTTGLGLDFDTGKLASFINDITLPDQDIEDARLATNLLLDAAGGAAGSIPIIGDFASTAIAVEQTLLNYKFDLLQVEAQKETARQIVNDPNYDTSTWGTITETNRDLVLIEDFQIGVDNIFLPSVASVANVGYAIKSGILNNQNGVFIEAQIGTENSNLVFIENNYGSLSNTDFTDQISNLLTSSGNQGADSGSIISTFNQTPITVQPLNSGLNFEIGSFAGDHIIGEELAVEPSNPDSGRFEFIGRFGDDLIQGSTQDDLLYGGFNSAPPTFANITYEDDGFDILQGGKGDDLLNGGSGNDTLDGGGFNYDRNINITSVIVEDGTDTLIGGSGNDTFVFNTLATGIDVITDFTVLIDTIQINKVEFGATDTSEFSFDQATGALSFGSQQFATLENNSASQQLQQFDVNRDIQLV